MHDDRQVQLKGEADLGLKQGQLFLPRDLPVVVEPALPDRDHLGVAIEGADRRHLGPPVPGKAGPGRGVLLDQALGVDAGRGVEKGVTLCQREAGKARVEVGAAVEHQPDPPRGQGGEQRVPVLVKGGGGIMGVGVKDHRHGINLAFVRCG